MTEKLEPKTEERAPIQTMTFEEYAEVHHEQPYVFELEAKGKKLVYFGAKHLNDPNDQMFKDLEQKLRALNPNLVLVEGITNFDERVKGYEEEIAKNLKLTSKEEAITSMGEAGLAMKLAADIGANFYSPEPRHEDQVENLLNRGLDRDSIYAFFMYRELSSRGVDFTDRSTVEEFLKSKIDEFRKLSNWDKFDYSLENLEAIGKKIWGINGDIMKPELALERVDPTPWKDEIDKQTPVNEVARQANYFRDRYMVGKIKEMLTNNDRIFIVFGASHGVTQEAAIRRIFAEL